MIVDMSLKCFSFHLFFMFLFAERLSAFSHNISIIFSHLGTNDHFALRFVVWRNRSNAFYSVLQKFHNVLLRKQKGEKECTWIKIICRRLAFVSADISAILLKIIESTRYSS